MMALWEGEGDKRWIGGYFRVQISKMGDLQKKWVVYNIWWIIE